jgi:hypothetical protein
VRRWGPPKPTRKARVELEEYTLSLGTLEPTFRRNLMAEAAEIVCCTRQGAGTHKENFPY